MHYDIASHSYPGAFTVGHREPLNGSRIAAYALVAVIHLFALGLLARMGTDTPMSRPVDETPLPPTFADLAVHRPPQPAIEAPAARDSASASAPVSARRDAMVRTAPAIVPAAVEPASPPYTPERTETLSVSGSGTTGIVASSADGDGVRGDGRAGSGNNGAAAGAPILRKLRPIRTPAPEYPPHALNFSEQGLVVLLVKVGVNGRPLETRVVKSSGFDDLDQAMRKQVLSEWRFAPAMEGGHPVEAFTLAEQRYVLNDPM
jgi:TonB family protein